jgi:acyl dehydratase
MSAQAILFEDFQPGALMGEQVEVYDAQQAQRWQAIFGDQAADGANGFAEGASMGVVNMMRAFLHVVTLRPPGNVHAKQQLRMRAMPQQGEAIRVAVHCAGKEMRRERRYVELKVQGTGTDNRALFDGLITLIWAA